MEVLRASSPPVADAFSALRSAVEDGPLDRVTVELITTAALAACGHSDAVAVHAARLRAQGVSLDAIQQAILAPLGAATVFSDAVAALRAVDSVGDA